MKQLAIFSIAALSLGSIYAADPQTPPPAADSPKPLPPLEQLGRPDHGPRKEMRNRREKPEGRKGFAPQGLREKGKADRQDKPRPGEMLARELNLTPEQKEKARAIMEATKPKIEAVREEGRAKVKGVMEDALKELRPILTPEQQAVLDDLQKLRADKAALNAATKPGKPKGTE